MELQLYETNLAKKWEMVEKFIVLTQKVDLVVEVGGGDNKTLLSPDVGGGGGGYFGGHLGESTRGDLMFYAELLKSDPSALILLKI